VAEEKVDGIRNLLASYARACDGGRFDELEQMFRSDAFFDAAGQIFKGAAAIRAELERRMTPERRGRHVISNTSIALNTDGTAWVVSDFMAFRPDESGRLAVASAGQYDDLLRQEGDRWQFERHVVTFSHRY